MMLITTLDGSFLVCCRLEVRCGWARLVSGLCQSSGARDYNVDYHIGRFVLGLL